MWHTPIPDGDLVLSIEYVQAVIGTLTILLVFLLARRVFDVRTGLIAAAIVAFYPNLITITATLQLETVFIALSLLAVLMLLPAATGDDPRVARLVAGGTVTGAVGWCGRPSRCSFSRFLGDPMGHAVPVAQDRARLALVTISMIAVIVPWTIRNAVALHTFIPVSTGIGPALCMSRNQEATGGLDTNILVRQCSPHNEKFAPGPATPRPTAYATRHAVHWVLAPRSKR